MFCLIIWRSCLEGTHGRERAFEAGGFIVLVQIRFEREGLVASFAFEGLERRVSLHVRSKVGAVSERLPTVSAAKRLLTRV